MLTVFYFINPYLSMFCHSMFYYRNPCFINPCFITPCFINPCFTNPVQTMFYHMPVLIHILRPSGCIWINTDVRGIYQTYLMILFLTDLYKMEITSIFLNIIEIEPNFRSLSYHDSIIKTFLFKRTKLEPRACSHLHQLKQKNNESYSLRNSLRSMAVLSSWAHERQSPNLLTVSLPSPAFIT